MKQHLRLNEYKVLFYRLSLAYIFYFFARVLFYIYNFQLLKVDSVTEFLTLCYYGLAFDTTAILYANLLFIVFSVFPVFKNIGDFIKPPKTVVKLFHHIHITKNHSTDSWHQCYLYLLVHHFY